jgi:signal transduction histidine kinase
MSQQCAPSHALTQAAHASFPVESPQVESLAAQQLKKNNAELQQYLEAQKRVIASLERRAGRSLDSLGVHVSHLSASFHQSQAWQAALAGVQNEVDSLSDLLSDAMLLQKLEAGKVEIKLEAIALDHLLDSVTRHLSQPNSHHAGRLVRQIPENLLPVLADQDLTEAVLSDLLARGLKYSDPDAVVTLAVDRVDDGMQICVTAQRFSPKGDRNFATEIVLCCRRVEAQNGTIFCKQTVDGLQTVIITLAIPE